MESRHRAVNSEPGMGLWVAQASVVALVGVLLIAPRPASAHASPQDANGNCPSTASSMHGWGNPNRSEEFDNDSYADDWYLYTGPGHDGNGVRTPEAVSVHDGVMTINGDAAGNSEGMAWLPGQLFGRWEACIQSPPASPNYHSVALLWPDSEVWPEDGEIDFMEIFDPQRQVVTASLMHRRDGSREAFLGPNFHTSANIDAAQWHSWAVEWTPGRVTGYVDGVQWFEVTDYIPQTPMHLCLQLDNLGGDISQGGQQLVDWVRQYPL